MLSLSSKTPRYDVFQKWKEQYGSIFTYWVGETPVVSIADFNLVRDTFIKDGDSYTGRNFFPKFQKILRGKKISQTIENYHFLDGKLLGLAITEGEIWKEQRRFTLHVLRNFGMGRNVMEGMVSNLKIKIPKNLMLCIQECQKICQICQKKLSKNGHNQKSHAFKRIIMVRVIGRFSMGGT